MDKEKEIEEIACILSGECKFGCGTCSILSEYGCSDYDSAKKLIDAGYGNVKQAVNEFAEDFHEKCRTDLKNLIWEYGEGAGDVIRIFDELLKERYGGEE